MKSATTLPLPSATSSCRLQATSARRIILRIILPLLLCGLCTPSHAIYKCQAQGSVTYSDRPCEGRPLDLPPPPPPSSSSSAKSDNSGSDALRREKSEVTRLQRIREQRERQDQQIRDLAARGAAARERKCKSLSLQLRWREEDLREANLQETKKARVRARRAAEKLAMECQ